MVSETFSALRRRIARQLGAIEVGRHEADLLIEYATDRALSWLVAHGEDPLPEETRRRVEEMTERRLGGEPLQYIAGVAEFYGREFRVDPRVLIPRPETEMLVERALGLIPRSGRVVDVGTGSGCIAATIALERTDVRVFAVDISFDALVVARGNARRLDARVRFTASDVLKAFQRPFDLVISNPPYIALADVGTLQREVQREPHIALSPGADPYLVIRDLYKESKELVAPGGTLLMEIGFGQAQKVREIATAAGWTVDEIVRDYSGIERVVVSSRDEDR